MVINVEVWVKFRNILKSYFEKTKQLLISYMLVVEVIMTLFTLTFVNQ